MGRTNDNKPVRYAIVNLHSELFLALAHQLNNLNYSLQGCTIDAYTFKKSHVKSFESLCIPYVCTSSSAWQSYFDTSKITNPQFLESFDSTLVEQSIQLARHRASVWLTHRENLGQGIDESILQLILNISTNNCITFLEKTKPSFVFFGLYPCTPFDILLASMCQSLGILKYSIGEINLPGLYYITTDCFAHGNSLVETKGLGTELKGRGERYLLDFENQLPYYIDKSILDSSSGEIQLSTSRLSDIQSDIKSTIKQYLKAIESGNFSNPFREKSSLVDEVGYLTSRQIKYFDPFQVDKEEKRCLYLKELSSRLIDCNKIDLPAVLIILDYYPETTRYPLGGEFYHVSNYIQSVHNIIKSLRQQGVVQHSGEFQILLKEHPAMLQPTRHSHVRSYFMPLVDRYGAKFVCPFTKTTDILRKIDDVIVIAGVSNAGLEASLMDIPVVSLAQPWWLSLHNTWFYDSIRRTVVPGKFGTHKLTYDQFLTRYCIDLFMDGTQIDTYSGKLSPKHLSSISSLGNLIDNDFSESLSD